MAVGSVEKRLLHHIIFNGTVLYDMFSEKTLNIRMIYLIVVLVLVSGKEAQRSNVPPWKLPP